MCRDSRSSPSATFNGLLRGWCPCVADKAACDEPRGCACNFGRGEGDGEESDGGARAQVSATLQANQSDSRCWRSGRFDPPQDRCDPGQTRAVCAFAVVCFGGGGSERVERFGHSRSGSRAILRRTAYRVCVCFRQSDRQSGVPKRQNNIRPVPVCRWCRGSGHGDLRGAMAAFKFSRRYVTGGCF